jgi:tetratricopeptide (TPR) repeat protein
MSYCYYKLKDWEKVIETSNKVLQYDEKNSKALYRRCYAFINKNEFKEAQKDLALLENLIKNSEELNNLKNTYEQAIKQSSNKEKSVYKKMYKEYRQGNVYPYISASE